MREIKFRAWDKQENRMLFQEGGWLFEKREFYPFGICVGFSHYNAEEDNFVLMQYTGLKDKNGKEIYEGDIVIMKEIFKGSEEFNKRTIIYKNGSFGIEVDPRFGLNEWSVIPVFIANQFMCKEDIEIIGNIYENPELLK